MIKSCHLYNFVEIQQHKFTSWRPRQQRLRSRFELDSCHRTMQSLRTIYSHSDSKARLGHVEVSRSSCKLGLSAESDEVRVPQALAAK